VGHCGGPTASRRVPATVQNAFVIVVVVVGVVGAIGAVACLLTSRRTWESLGRDRLLMESELRERRPRTPAGRGTAAALSTPDTPAARAERDTEVRQMLQARNDRRRRRGEPELEVEAELQRLTAAPASSGTPTPPPAVDAELRDEVRALVIARNHRRARRGLPALDVESEVERELARLP
jgi:hypothetical protein